MNTDDNTGDSLYFSHDTGRTVANLAFKSLHNIGKVNEKNSDGIDKLQNLIGNMTIEGSNNEVKTAKKRKPLREFQYEFMQEYSAMSSTASKSDSMLIQNYTDSELKHYDSLMQNEQQVDNNGDGSHISLNSMSESEISLEDTLVENKDLDFYEFHDVDNIFKEQSKMKVTKKKSTPLTEYEKSKIDKKLSKVRASMQKANEQLEKMSYNIVHGSSTMFKNSPPKDSDASRKLMFPSVSRSNIRTTIPKTAAMKQTKNMKKVKNEDKKEKSVVAATTGAYKKEKIYNCNHCTAQFSVKALHDAHKRAHENDNAAKFLKKSSTAQSMSLKPVAKVADFTNNNSNQCKFCDKKFTLRHALNIHLMENCEKIPPNEKRKLDFADLKHGKKPQLPKLENTNRGNSLGSIKKSSISEPGRKKKSYSISYGGDATDMLENPIILNDIKLDFETKVEPTKSSISEPRRKKKSYSISYGGDATDMSENPIILNDIKLDFETKVVPKTSKPRKSNAIDLQRKSRKSIKCHKCDERFKNVFDYAKHSVENHPLGTNLEGTTQSCEDTAQCEENENAQEREEDDILIWKDLEEELNFIEQEVAEIQKEDD